MMGDMVVVISDDNEDETRQSMRYPEIYPQTELGSSSSQKTTTADAGTKEGQKSSLTTRITTAHPCMHDGSSILLQCRSCGN
jgi:hypothetical protein